MASTAFWICNLCGFVNAPHAYRRGDANLKCEQCGGEGLKDGTDVTPAEAVGMKVSAAR